MSVAKVAINFGNTKLSRKISRLNESKTIERQSSLAYFAHTNIFSLRFLCYSEFLFLPLQRIVDALHFARHIEKTKRYAQLADRNVRNFCSTQGKCNGSRV